MRAVAMLQVLHGRLDAAAGDEQRPLDLGVAQAIAVDVHLGPQLDLGLDLHLPLVLRGETGLGDHVQHAPGATRLGQQLGIPPVAGQAILAGRGHDDRAALAHHLAAALMPLTDWYRFWSSG